MADMVDVLRVGTVLLALVGSLMSCAFQGDASADANAPYLDANWQTAAVDVGGEDGTSVPVYQPLTECVTSTVHAGPYMKVWLSGKSPEEGMSTIYADGSTLVLERFADRRCKTKLMTNVMRRDGATTSTVPGEAWNWQLVFWTGEIVELDVPTSCVSCHTYCPNDGVCGDYTSQN